MQGKFLRQDCMHLERCGLFFQQPQRRKKRKKKKEKKLATPVEGYLSKRSLAFFFFPILDQAS
jgi:hypothetical protein